MFSFCYEFTMQTAAFSDGFEQRKIDIEPVEGIAFHILVNHLLIHFAIVGTIQIDVVLVLIDVFEVGGVDEDLTARIQQCL